MQTFILLLPAIIGLSSGLAASVFLYASQLIRADEGDYHLGGIPYVFDSKTIRQAFLSGGIMGIAFLYLIPYTAFGIVSFHWVPILIIGLLTAQSFIDLRYFELADEWNMALGVLAVLWIQLTVGIGMAHVWLAFGLFFTFYLSWFFLDYPGYGDVKMVLAGAVLVGGFFGAYQFVFYSSLLAVVMTLVSCYLDGVPRSMWMKQRFALGPYLALTIGLALSRAL